MQCIIGWCSCWFFGLCCVDLHSSIFNYYFSGYLFPSSFVCLFFGRIMHPWELFMFSSNRNVKFAEAFCLDCLIYYHTVFDCCLEFIQGAREHLKNCLIIANMELTLSRLSSWENMLFFWMKASIVHFLFRYCMTSINASSCIWPDGSRYR